VTGADSSDLKRHLAGESLTLSQAVKAKCCDCMAGYVDGRVSCELATCPLFPFHVYNPSRRYFRQGKSGRVRELLKRDSNRFNERLLPK